jgi:hypothetical protein
VSLPESFALFLANLDDRRHVDLVERRQQSGALLGGN